MNINMNFSQSSNQNESSVASENDLQKLMNICNSYGLNQEETNQIISQFRRGALYSQPSLNDSLNQSLGEMTFSQNQHQQQYSFKHGKGGVSQENARAQFIKLQEQDQRENQANQTARESVDCQSNGLQKLLFQKLSIQKDLVLNIQQQNQSLKRALQEKETTINDLINMKRQDADTIHGLKDIITNLTAALRQKQHFCKDLQEKYSQCMQSRVNQLSQRRSALDFTESSFQDISNSIGNRKQSKMKQSNLQSKDTKSSSSMEVSNLQLKKPKQPNRIDIKKYKQMIENMRNNY